MITNTMLAWGDQLGAQMSTYASLYFIAKKNGQELVLLDELKNFRRGFQFLDVFDNGGFHIIKGKIRFIDKFLITTRKGEDWKTQMDRIYNSRFFRIKDTLLKKMVSRILKFEEVNDLENGVYTHKQNLKLESLKNYNIQSGFGTCKEWDVYREDIKNIFLFKDEVVEQGNKKWNELNLTDKKTVSVHFRLTDYLVMSSLNLQLEYYKNAMEKFTNDTTFVVFSDDIDRVKKYEIFKNKEVVFMEANKPGVDMYLMSRCQSNIIANSSFSFWGAYLNKHDDKVVVCPRDFIGKECSQLLYINGNWYPSEWIAL